MFKIRKKFKFEAAHRLVSSYSKPCQRIHGHSYTVEVCLKSEILNKDGMVLDFGRLKKDMAEAITQFDHKLVLNVKDDYLKGVVLSHLGPTIVDFNPTAEEMARFFFNEISAYLYDNEDLRHIGIDFVRVHETETGYAEYSE